MSVYNFSNNGSPSFSHISLAGVRSRATPLLERIPTRTSTLRVRRGGYVDPNEELTFIPGTLVRDSVAAGEPVHSLLQRQGEASRLGTGRSPSPPLLSSGPLFTSRTSRRRLLPEDGESISDIERTILPSGDPNHTADTLRLEQFSDLSVVHNLRGTPQQIPRNSLGTLLESSQITVVPNSIRRPASQASQHERELFPSSPTTDILGIGSLSRITATPPPFRSRTASISKQAHNLPPPSPTGEVPYSPGYEKRLVEEAGRKNDQFKFSTLDHTGSPAEDYTFDADNLPSFHLSSPIASSTPRATSKFFAREGKRVGEETILTIDQYQDSDETEGNATILQSKSGFLLPKEVERPASQSSVWSGSEADTTGDTMGFTEEREARNQRRAQRQLRRETRLHSIQRQSGDFEGQVRDQGGEPLPLSPIRETLAEDVGRGRGDDRSRIWTTIGNRNSTQNRDITSPRPGRGNAGGRPGVSASTAPDTKVALQDDSSGTLSLGDVDLVTPRPRVSRSGIFTRSFRPALSQRGESSESRSENRSSGPRHSLKPPFSTSIADLSDPASPKSMIEQSVSKPHPTMEPGAPKILPTEDESTADVTKEMEIAGAPVVVLRRSRRNREASKSPEEIAANESEVRDALRAFSRQASASPSNDQSLTEETRVIVDKGKGKQTTQVEDNEENKRLSETDYWETRDKVAESLSKKQFFKPLHELLRDHVFGNQNQQTKERLEERAEEQTTHTMTEQPVPRTRDAANDKTIPARHPTLRSPFLPEGRRRAVGSSLPPQGHPVEAEPPTTSIPPTKLDTPMPREAAPLASTESGKATAEAALRRSTQTTVNRPIPPPLRPSTPESRKNKAHLYGKGQLQSPGSDYNFDEDSGIDRGLVDLLSTRPGQKTQPVPPPQPSKRLQQVQPLPELSRTSETPPQKGKEYNTAEKPLPAEPMKHVDSTDAEPVLPRKPFHRLKDLLFGYSKPTAQPRSTESGQATTQPEKPTRSTHSSSHPQQVPLPTQPMGGYQAFPKGTKTYFPSTPKKGNQRVITAGDPTVEDYASFNSSPPERDFEYQTPATDTPHQRVLRETGDSDIEANPRFITLLKEAEMTLLRRMNNRLETLQLEIRSTKRGIETLEQRLVGSDSEISSSAGAEADTSAGQTAPEYIGEEHSEVKMDEMLKTYIAKRVAEEQAAADARVKRVRGADRWVVEHKWTLVLGLCSIAFLTCMFLEVLMLSVCVRVPCRSDMEFTSQLCRLCYLRTLNGKIPVDEGDDLEYLPLGSPMLGLLARTMRGPGLLLKSDWMASIGEVGGWIEGSFIWLGTVLWGSVSAGAGVIWDASKSWGELLVSSVTKVCKIFLAALSVIWFILSWGTSFTTNTSDQVNTTTSFTIPSSALLVPTSASSILTGHTASGSMGDDDTVLTIVVDAGLETPVVVETQEAWWIEYQEQRRREAARD